MQKLLSGIALALCLLCVPGLATASEKAATKDAQKGVVSVPLIIEEPITAITITIPILLVEHGEVESIDAKAGSFVLKRKDNTTVTIGVSPTTIMENIYLDVFSWESSKGIGDLKKGDKIRARVFPPQTEKGPEQALLVDVYHW